MSEDSKSKNVKGGRTVLGDVSNRPVKRGFSSISGVKSGDVKGKSILAGNGDSISAKKVCLGVGNLASQNSENQCSDDDNRGKLVSVVSNSSEDVQETLNPAEGICVVPSGCVNQNVVDIDDASRDSLVSIDSIRSSERSEDCYVVGEKCQSEKGKVTADVVMQSNVVDEAAVRTFGRDGDGHDVSASRSAGSAEQLNVRTVQGSRGFELEKCTGVMEGCANTNEGDNLLKGCACSFCIKAAYIWSDLNYQDAKGRIGALKKSQKEASNLVQNVSKGKESEFQGVGSSTRPSRLETDLSEQWRSLFLHMEDIFLREINQVQNGLSALKELRENCKADLDNISDDKH